MDAVALVSTNKFQGFVSDESVVAVFVVFKGAFNSVLPGVFFDQLRCLGPLSGILNFTSYITSHRELRFSADGSGTRTCDMSVIHGEILSPILFNIYTSGLIYVLSFGIRYSMYADVLDYLN